MTNRTDTLIKTLSQDLKAVQPLQNPWIRTLRWLGVLIPYCAIAVLLLHFVGKLPSPFLNSQFLLEQVFAILTGITAAMAAFASTIPGRRRSYLLWPLIPMLGWLATLGQACFRSASGGISFQHNLLCLPFIIILGTPPAIVLLMMLRRGAPLTPSWTAALGALAAAGFGNFCVRLVHAEDVSVMLIVWHIGGIFILAAASSAFG
ncbi:MAG TPA: NrsF family protein, partial [Terriglobia bacterium]|nr:NrsF family protein [Terriglobia bacterium]